jgi:hypothetical protein
MALSTENLNAMVQALGDREAIRECLMRYTRGVDRLDREMCLSAYHSDAVDDHGKYVGGREGFVDWAFAQHSKAHLSTQHYLCNHFCELAGDIAHSETYYMLVVMNVEGEIFSTNGGRYIDRFEKREGKWAIMVRKVIRDWVKMDQRPDMSDLSLLTSTRGGITPELRAFMNDGEGARRDRTDPSYQRPLQIKPGRVEAYQELVRKGHGPRTNITRS